MFLRTWLPFVRRKASRQAVAPRRCRQRAAVRLSLEPLEDRQCPSGSYLLVADYDNGKVLRYDASTGTFIDEFVPKHSGGLNQPQMLVFGPHDHDLYVSSGHFARADQHRGVLRYDGDTGAFVEEITEDGHLESVHYIIFGPDGNVYVGDRVGSLGHHTGGRIVRFDGKSGAFLDDFVSTDSGGLKHAFGLVFGPGSGASGLDLYVANGPGNILRYDGHTGDFLGAFVATASGGLDFPAGITFGPDGNLYVASAIFRGGAHGIMRFQGPSGSEPGAFIDLFVPLGTGGLLSPTGVLFGPDGNGDGHQDLYVTSVEATGQGADKAKNGTVKRYDGVTGAFIDTFIPTGQGGSGLNNPSGLTFTETDPVTLAYTGASFASAASAAHPVNERPGAGHVQPPVGEAQAPIVTVSGGGRAVLTDPAGIESILQFQIVAVQFADGSVQGHATFVFRSPFAQDWGAVAGVDLIWLGAEITAGSADDDGTVTLNGVFTERDISEGASVAFVEKDTELTSLFQIVAGGDLGAGTFTLKWCLLPEFEIEVTQGELNVG